MDIEFKLSTESVESAGLVRPLCVESDTSVGDVFELLRQHHSGCVLIVDRQRLVGLFTERDALRLMHRGIDPDAPIRNVMIDDPVTIRPQATVGSAILRMSSGGYRRLPVVDDKGQPLGLIQVSSIIHYLVEHFPQTVYNQNPMSTPLTQNREGP